MNVEKVVFGFFIILALTLNHHNIYEFYAVILVNLLAMGLKLGDRSPSQALSARDEVLFCGTRHAERHVGATLNNEYTLQYLVSGVQESRGYIMKWFARRAA
ncbi:MAG: hypothetical protein E2O38_08805 [Proteobacteria bacterium]|nr:MAG: hypothetical protein E2O38_08805 [Pseudomonadota bacterium]